MTNDNEIPDLGEIVRKKQAAGKQKHVSAATPLRDILDAVSKGEIPANAMVYVCVGFHEATENGVALKLVKASVHLNRIEAMGFLDIHHQALMQGTV
jgi:hypothetical protein